MSDEYKLEDSLGFLTGKVNRHLTLRLFRRFKQENLDVTAEQWLVMVHLWKKDGISQQELADRVERDMSVITRMLVGLEKKQLVTRLVASTDRRIKLIQLTTKGRELQHRLVDIAQANLLDAQRNIPSEDLMTCINVLRQMHRNLTE